MCVCGGLHGWPRHDGQSPSSQGGGVCVCVGGPDMMGSPPVVRVEVCVYVWVAQT